LSAYWTSPDPSRAAAGTAVFVVYATSLLDLDWLPDSAEIVVVHNDASLDRRSTDRRRVTHIEAGSNVGFGAAVNLALPSVATDRIVLCNPDVSLTELHWNALVDASPDDVVTVPLVDSENRPTSVTSRYPSGLSHLISGYRLGRYAPRGGRARSILSRGLGSWGRAHEQSLRHPAGSWPLRERWVSGAVLSIDSARLRAIGGFDERYFLYYEDVDLCRRFSRRFPTARAVVADVAPGSHQVGGSARTDTLAARDVERLRLGSAVRYADQPGLGWRACERLLHAKQALRP
jgi:hypothetical protein